MTRTLEQRALVIVSRARHGFWHIYVDGEVITEGYAGARPKAFNSRQAAVDFAVLLGFHDVRVRL